MHRFFVPCAALPDGQIRLPGPVAHQLFRVLRLRPGATVALFGGDGEECEAIIEELSPREGTARILCRRRPGVELPSFLHVAVAVLKGEKLDWVVQKLTELGAARITFLQTERTVVAAGEERWPRRMERFERIAREAAEQSGRVRVPELRGPQPLGELLGAETPGPRLILDPTAELRLADALAERPERLLLLIGPEGGFSPDEVAAARAAGWTGVRLGRRTLRAETAAVAAAAAVVAALE